MFRSHSDRVYQTQNTNNDHNVNIFYKCDFCTDQYLSETEVEVHKHITHKKDIRRILDQPECCRICITNQRDRTTLIEHIKTEHLFSSKTARRVEREIFMCDYCDQLYFNKLLLEAHMIVNHLRMPKRSKVECPRCNKIIVIRSMWIHFQHHMIQSVACCRICLLKCQNRDSLREHIKTHPRYYYCTICGYDTKVEQRFHEHVANHEINPQIREIECKSFFKPTTKKDILKCRKQVLQGLCLPKEIRICILCREICTNRYDMKIHVSSVHGTREIIKKKHLCSCGEEFFNSVLLKQHIFKLKGDHRVFEEFAEGLLIKKIKHKAYKCIQKKEELFLTDNMPESEMTKEEMILPDNLHQM